MSRCSKKIPTLKLGCKGLDAGLRAAEDQGVDVVRAFVGVDHLEVDEVADDAELVGDAVAAEHVATDALPSSFMRPRRRRPCRPSVISVCMSASFFWISWFAASGRPNCLRSRTYRRARCQQSSAAPSAPQAMP